MHGLAFTLLHVGLIFVAAGFILLYFPPKNVNYFYGYRTFSSMRNEDTWRTANKYSSKLMIYLGLDLLIISGISYFLFPDLGENSALIGAGFIILSAILLIVLTEIHLRRNFDKNGNRKNNSKQLLQ